MKTKVEVDLYSCDNCEGDICYSTEPKTSHNVQSMVGDKESDFHFCCSSCMDDYFYKNSLIEECTGCGKNIEHSKLYSIGDKDDYFMQLCYNCISKDQSLDDKFKAKILNSNCCNVCKNESNILYFSREDCWEKSYCKICFPICKSVVNIVDE